MEHLHSEFTYDRYPDLRSLPEAERSLLERAREISSQAHAPYSRFRVGAAFLLANGRIIGGSNQENASFPLGLCAERVGLATADSLFPRIAILSLAISYQSPRVSDQEPLSPCGICRQALLERESSQGSFIRLILGGPSGPVYLIAGSACLLPLAFNSCYLSGT